jgi:Phage integrase, N-terminal SAM-like domain
MTQLRRKMLEELQRRNYSDRTIRHYLQAAALFAKHFGKRPDQFGPDELLTQSGPAGGCADHRPQTTDGGRRIASSHQR